MLAKRFWTIACVCAALGAAPATFAQSVKENSLDDMPAVDKNRAPPTYRTTRPPPPPPVPPAPRVTTRTPPPGDEEARPPAREVPPPPGTTTRRAPPPRLNETPDTRRADTTRRAEPPPRLEERPARRAEPPRRPPSKTADRSAFYAKCTEQCHLSCEAAFEACNGDSSPAQPACVKKLESCRIERCSCRFE
jgi:hypothetical protein